MPRTEEQFEEIREQKINLIMQTALELFANEGYYLTSISRIAKKAGISKGLMYNYFNSKEELVLALIDKSIEKLTESIDPDQDGFLTEAEFEFHVNENFRILVENTDYWKLYFSMMMQPAVFKLVTGKFPDLLPHYKDVIEDYFRRKGVPDPKIEATCFDAMLDGIFLNYVMNPSGFPLENIRKTIIKRFK
ncbi:MAG: TetR/AcrR family transcriptional regulator [Bacteroidales bacterium]|jgi:AcrR family transcriptional regulator|nr:TetR/AcrR family transcriptional regulator [Bacteroidales bacterium]